MKLTAEDQEYTIQKGDSYTSIAKKFYGDVVFRKQIRKANDYQDLVEGDIIIIPALVSHEELTFTQKYWDRKSRRGKS